MRLIMGRFLLFFCIAGSPLLHAMEDVMVHYIAKADCDVQRTLAVLNRAYNKRIEEHFRPNKKRIEQFMLEKKTPLIPGEVSWNKYFNACAWVTIKPCAVNKERKWWGLSVVEYKDRIIEKNESKVGFYFPAIEGNMRPFFNEDGYASFHGYADVWIMPNDYQRMCQSIVEFSLKPWGCQFSRCFICLDENDVDKVYDFYYFFNFPALVKAFLQSSTVRYHERSFADGQDYANYYDISGVTIPEDYRTYKAHPFFQYCHCDKAHPFFQYCHCDNEKFCDRLTRKYRYPFSAYNQFPEELRNAIDNKYAQQQGEKNNQNS